LKRFVAGVVCLLLVCGASLQPARTQGAKPFRVAMILGTTGPTAAQQQAVVTGARAAAKKINAEGGILGRPVEITVFDHQFDPARAVRMLQQDVLTQQWDLIYPGGGAATSGPMLPFVTRAKLLALAPFLNLNSAQLTADNPYFFDLQPTPLDAAAAFAQYIAKFKPKKLAILYQSDAYGQGTFRAYDAALKKEGIATVAEPYDIGTVDITPTLLKLQAENPDRMFAVAFGAPAGHVLNSMEKLGWDIPIVGDLGFGLTDLPSLAPAHSYAKLIVQTFRVNAYVPPAKRTARFNTFLSAIKEAGPIAQGLQTYTFGWDTIMLAALAAKRASSTDPAKMVEALEHLNLPERQRTYVAYSEYNFTPQNHVVYTGPQEYSFVPYTPFSDGMVGNR
jgi:branched-chain amino acid transport system substrate-binding protein